MPKDENSDVIMVHEECGVYIKDGVLYYKEGAVRLDDIVEVRVDSLILSYLAIVLLAAIFGFLVLGALAMILLSPMVFSGKVVVKTVGGSEVSICYGNCSKMEEVKNKIMAEVRRVRANAAT